jgi:hypothetical protein
MPTVTPTRTARLGLASGLSRLALLGVVAALLMTAGLALAIGPLDPLAANAAARCA